MSNGSLSNNWQIYGEVFCLHAHQLLAWAYVDARDDLNPDMEEPDITGLLANAMKRRLDYHPETSDEYLHYSVGDQEPHSPDGQRGNDRLRFDIAIIRSGIRPRLSFIFEAKRLRTGGFPIGKYIGEGGMGDFIACRYGADYPEAAMIGLFQNKDVSYWHAELKRVVKEDQLENVPRLAIRANVAPIEILPSLPNELNSIHRRINGSDIRLYHIFLCCCEGSPTG